MSSLAFLLLFHVLILPALCRPPVPPTSQTPLLAPHSTKDARVLILGGGVAGITAAHALHERGIEDFIVVEAREELGGRMMSHVFGAPDRQYTVELGANWVQGTRTGDGPENPIWTLAKKHGIRTQFSSYFDGLTTYDETGQVDFRDIVFEGAENFDRLIASAGSRVPKSLVDASARTGYSLTGSYPHHPHEMAAEYYQFDWEFTTSPEESSWIASSWNNNYTFSTFSEENAMSIDPRGFKTLVQAEAVTFVRHGQLRLNSTVSVISYSVDGVRVTLADGRVLTADYAICTFSLGVLQHQEIQFVPALPAWKQEAIHSMTMGVYTKIFLQFPQKFWFDTETGLYADRERGRYPVWQSLDHPKFFPGCGILFATVTGAHSKRIEALPKEQVLSEVMSVLSSMFSDAVIPPPSDFYFKSWSEDPLYRGSYATWPPAFLPEHHVNLRADLDGKVWFAGEAMSKYHFGYLQGAYFEGRNIGLEVADCILEGGCLGLEHIEQVKNARPYTSD